MKGQSAQDGNLVDRFDELVSNGRAWLVSEIALLKGKAEFAARTYVLAVGIFLVAVFVSGTALVFLALSAVTAMTPYVGLAGAYAITSLGGLTLGAALCGYAYWSITQVSRDAVGR